MESLVCHEFQLLCQVEDAERVLKARVPGTGIDQVDKSQLADVAKALKVFGVYEGQ